MNFLDTNNPIVKLCIEGMQCEAAGRFAEASALFMQAWHQGQSDLDFCIAAHYVARHQKNPVDTLHWNQVSLSHAKAVNDEQILGFYPSLYLNIGHSFEVLGDLYEAKPLLHDG